MTTSTTPTIALATDAKHPQLTEDDRLLLPALAALGLRGEPAVWDDPAVDWRRFAAVVVRSTWDYPAKAACFREWIDRLEAAGVPLWNPPALLRWNADKVYLRDLAARGIAVCPTAWIEPGDARPLAAVLEQSGWAEAVVKPAVSAGGLDTWRTTRARATADEAAYRALVARGTVMVQPFLPEVLAEGEWSFLFFGGAFSHAVIKRAAPGEFRVQEQHGGSRTPTEAPAALVTQATAVLAAAPAPALYARVDGCIVDGRLTLMELEALEPSLFLLQSPHAAARLATALVEAL